jgi:tricorn protease
MKGYYRFPTVHGSDVVFVSEDDLWHVPLEGGIARRITSGRGPASNPVFSPDGSKIAFTGTEEGTPEVFVVAARGGPVTQLTWLASRTVTAAWSPDGEDVLFRTSHAQPFPRPTVIFSVGAEGGEPRDLGLGSSTEIAFGPGGARAISRNSDDLARWKRYRGGTAAVLWMDSGDGEWKRLFSDDRAGHCRPMFLGDRLWFLTDRDGCGNLWSCTLDGDDVRQETHFEGFYVRFPTTDGTSIVFCHGGDLYRMKPGGEPEVIDVDYASPRTQLQRRFVDAEDYLHDVTIHPKGHSLAVTSRGKLYNFGLWEGAVRRTGEGQGVRYRLPEYINDGADLLVVSDEGGEEFFEIHAADGTSRRRVEVSGIDDIGRPLGIWPCPVDDRIVFSNHRQELIILDPNSGEATLVAKSIHDRIIDFDWSHDGRWIAFSFPQGMRTSQIRIYDTQSGETHAVTEGSFYEGAVCFDPKGRYLYFTSARFFEPVYDEITFDLGFPHATKPCVVTLQADLDSPFFEKPRPLDSDGDEDDEDGDEAPEDADAGDVAGDDATDGDAEATVDAHTQDASAEAGQGERGEGEGGEGDDALGEDGDDGGDGDEDAPEPVEIDFDDIATRIEAFPAPTGNYFELGATDKAVFWTQYPTRYSEGPSGVVKMFKLDERETKTFATNVFGFILSVDNKTMALFGEGLQVVSTSGPGPVNNDEDDDKPSRKSGWIDLERLSVEVDPVREWPQMLREAWRLMRDHFWNPDMAGVDWNEVWSRYRTLVPRLGSRAEFSDVVWCMQGELGTSHAYEMGGDYREPPRYRPGFLGADLVWDAAFEHGDARGGFRIERIIRGDGWRKGNGSPLLRPGANVREGDHIVAINGQRLTKADAVQRILVNEAGREVELVVVEQREGEDPKTRTVTVRALAHELSARYRDWVEANRRHVHESSGGRVGYVHIPDMVSRGYAEFHRGYFSEHERDALIVDVRNNGGGHVSQLILEKLARRRIGYDITRWGQPRPYPEDSVLGPIVGLTDEHAGSDGDIFSHCFKLMELGPLLGKRTWGGVVGIWPRHGLVDGSYTTQPEFSFWFKDVGFDVENYGTDPDIEVELEPESRTGIEDAQLNAAIGKAMELLEEEQPSVPTFDLS